MSDYEYFTLSGILLIFLVATLLARFASALVRRRLKITERGSTEDTQALEARAATLTRAVTLSMYGLAAIASVSLAIWRYAPGQPLTFEALASRLVSRSLNIIVIIVGATIVVRAASLMIAQLQRRLERRRDQTDLEFQRRASTIGGILSRLVSVTVGFVAVLMLLRELSIDVVPILTAAGISGLAIGFGAQNLVRDVISGFFMILEDQVRVGDLARINGITGGVEEINLRTIVVRDGEGAVHFFPNGTITALANLSKQFAFAVVDVRVAYGENLDRVVSTLREVGESIRSDASLGPLIVGPLEILGVQSIDGGATTIRARFKTLPLSQGKISTDLRSRVITMFVARGIRPYAGSSR